MCEGADQEVGPFGRREAGDHDDAAHRVGRRGADCGVGDPVGDDGDTAGRDRKCLRQLSLGFCHADQPAGQWCEQPFRNACCQSLARGGLWLEGEAVYGVDHRNAKERPRDPPQRASLGAVRMDQVRARLLQGLQQFPQRTHRAQGRERIVQPRQPDDLRTGAPGDVQQRPIAAGQQDEVGIGRRRLHQVGDMRLRPADLRIGDQIGDAQARRGLCGGGQVCLRNLPGCNRHRT
ncbi:hypothetical protein D3C81_1010120 [compost metagenome]